MATKKNSRVITESVRERRGERIKRFYVHDPLGIFDDHPTRDHYVHIGTLRNERFEIATRYNSKGGWGYNRILVSREWNNRELNVENTMKLVEWLADDALRVLYGARERYVEERNKVEAEQTAQAEKARNEALVQAGALLKAQAEKARNELYALVTAPTLNVDDLYGARLLHFAMQSEFSKFNTLVMNSATNDRVPGWRDDAWRMADEVIRKYTLPPSPRLVMLG